MTSYTETENETLVSNNQATTRTTTLRLGIPTLRSRAEDKSLKINTTKSYQFSRGYTVGDSTSEASRLALYQGIIFATLFVGYGFYTYARKIFSYSAPTLMGLNLLSQNGVGIVNSSQYFAYAISKFLGGILSDKISAKLLFPIGLVISGSTAVCVAFSSNPKFWALLWFINGLGQGCGWPACSKLLKKWFSSKQFGTFWSVLSTSSNLSGAIGPIAAAYCLVSFGWKVSFIVSGILSISIGVISLFLLHDSPKDVSLLSPCSENVTSIQLEKVSESKTSSQDIESSYKQMFRSPLLWVISACYLIVFGTKTALGDWGQIFLIEDLGQTQIQASTFSSSIETGGFIGGILAGVLTDKFNKKMPITGNPRLLISTLFMIICVFSLHILIFMTSPQTPQILISLVGIVCGASLFGPISIFGIVASESFPASISGTSHAVVALAANVGAIAAGWPLSVLALSVGWKTCFFICQVLMAGAVCVIFFTRNYQSIQKIKNT